MSVLQILVLIGLAVLLGFLRRGRSLALVGLSALVIYWIQPAGTIFPSLSFWFPTLTLFVTVLSWAITAPPEARGFRANWSALTVLIGVILFVIIFPAQSWLQFPSPDSLGLLALALVLFIGFSWGLSLLKTQNRILLVVFALGFLAIFIFLKSSWLYERVLVLTANWRGITLDLTKQTTIAWLGYSYFAFRILHTIRDRQNGVLPAVGLAEYIDYVIFFPSFTAGPIDRLERFVKELRVPLSLSNDDWLFAGQRLATGLFKKFFVADLLGLVSITDALVAQTNAPGWLWLELCAYSLRVYFDFSGYTDIAIGMARLMGFRLPENFAAPFLKPNLTQFWSSWHITLTQWFRSYFFNPFTRFLRTSKLVLPAWLVILLTQISTMVLIGLWHGISWNFALWGLWHGLGLFVQNRWSEFIRLRFPDLGTAPVSRMIHYAVGVFFTFSFFTLGMLFFALSTPQLSFAAFLKLFGIF